MEAARLARRLELILDTMAEGVFTVDLSGQITSWNRAMEQLTGYTADEAVGRHCSLIGCDACNAQRGACGVEHCELFGRGEVHALECHVRRKDGTTVPVRKNARVLYEDGEVLGAVETLTDQCALKLAESRAAQATAQLRQRYALGSIVGKSPRMQELYEQIELAAASDVSVLVTGETGTGKELVAGAIHTASARREQPFVKVNCSALSESLLESELFGHVKGAFTGAYQDKVGRFEAADGGTLLLDEVGDVSPLIQLKLLRVLQEHEFERVGESATRRADVRVIAATHRDLRDLMRAGQFREDLYYRLKVFALHVPALRERREDIRLLVDHFIRVFGEQTGKPIAGVEPDAARVLLDYCWPGNVRELENAIEHAFVTCSSDRIGLFDLPVDIRRSELRSQVCPDGRPGTHAERPGGHQREADPQEALLAALEATNGNKAAAARLLGINRTTLWRRMKQYEMEQ
jgi:PAS domain S-box-containing protein